MNCKICGYNNAVGAKFCAKCGASLKEKIRENENVCKYCGHTNIVGAKFCAECGATFAKKSKKKVLFISVAAFITIAIAVSMFWVLSPNAFDKQIKVGYNLLNEGKYEEAIIAFDKAIKIEPKRHEGYIGKATTIAESGGPIEEVIDVMAIGYKKTDGSKAIADGYRDISAIYEEMGNTEASSVLERIGNLQEDLTCGFIKGCRVIEAGGYIITVQKDGIYLKKCGKDNEQKIADGDYLSGYDSNIISDGKVIYYFDNSSKQIKSYNISNSTTELMADLSKEFEQKADKEFGSGDGYFAGCSGDYLYFNAFFGAGNNNTYTINTQNKEWELAWPGGAGFLGFKNNKAYFYDQQSAEGFANIVEADYNLKNGKIIANDAYWYGKMIGSEIYYAYGDDYPYRYKKYDVTSGRTEDVEHGFTLGYAALESLTGSYSLTEDDTYTVWHYSGTKTGVSGQVLVNESDNVLLYNTIEKKYTYINKDGIRDVYCDLKMDAIGIYDNSLYYTDKDDNIKYCVIKDDKVVLSQDDIPSIYKLYSEKIKEFLPVGSYDTHLYSTFDIDKNGVEELIILEQPFPLVFGYDNGNLVDYGTIGDDMSGAQQGIGVNISDNSLITVWAKLYANDGEPIFSRVVIEGGKVLLKRDSAITKDLYDENTPKSYDVSDLSGLEHLKN